MAETHPLPLSGPSEGLEEVLPTIRSAFGFPSIDLEGSPIGAAFSHHFQNVGSLARPRLALEVCRSLGVDSSEAVGIAACIEALHNASLVQDDLQDQALERRGAPSVQSQFGPNTALGLATCLTSSAFACLNAVADGGLRSQLTNHVSKAVRTTVIGQTDDLDTGKDRNIGELLDIARRKSGPLFALAVELPLLANRQVEVLNRAHAAAVHFGLGYQIYDDIRDQEIDRLDPGDANVVNALAQDEPREAVETARKLAQSELTNCCQLARGLPCGSGQRLVAMAEQLLQRLES